MPPHTAPTFLLWRRLSRHFWPPLNRLLSAAGERVEVVLSAQAALASMIAPRPPGLALLDESLPGMPIGQLLAKARAQTSQRTFPHCPDYRHRDRGWIDRLAEGAIDDLILRSAESSYWQLRIDLVLRNQRMARELETLRDSSIRNAQLDRLTGVYNREALLATLFRETDRVQRMNSSLSLVLFDIDDFGHWNSRLGVDACDELLCQVASRTGALLRSYDLLGRPGMDEFLIALPCCTAANAMSLTERLRVECFPRPSAWPAKPSASPPASASRPAMAAPRWWSCARPKRLSNGPRPPAPNPSSASAALRSPHRRRSLFSLPPPATNCWRGGFSVAIKAGDLRSRPRLASSFIQNVIYCDCARVRRDPLGWRCKASSEFLSSGSQAAYSGTRCVGCRRACFRTAMRGGWSRLERAMWELKTADERTWYRVIYLTRICDALYVLHAFEKKSRKTDRRDIEVAKSRLRVVLGQLRKTAEESYGREG